MDGAWRQGAKEGGVPSLGASFSVLGSGSGPQGWLKPIREPLALFVVGAVVVFAVDGLLRPAPVHEITVTVDQVRGLAALFESRTGVKPAQNELRTLVDELVEEEALYRHGVALGMVDGDPIVRRRIVSKIRQAARQLPEPNEEVLRAWFARHADRFARPGRLSVEHRFYGEGDTGRDAATRAVGLKEPPDGLPLAFGGRLAEASEERLGQWLGQDALRLARTAPLHTWVGPVRTPYGWHVLRVTKRRPRRPRSWAEARSAATRVYLEAQRDDAERRAAKRAVERYRVTVDWPNGVAAAHAEAP